jgi:hypothetical protein
MLGLLGLKILLDLILQKSSLGRPRLVPDRDRSHRLRLRGTGEKE